jgi:hypothetical protein
MVSGNIVPRKIFHQYIGVLFSVYQARIQACPTGYADEAKDAAVAAVKKSPTLTGWEPYSDTEHRAGV